MPPEKDETSLRAKGSEVGKAPLLNAGTFHLSRAFNHRPCSFGHSIMQFGMESVHIAKSLIKTILPSAKGIVAFWSRTSKRHATSTGKSAAAVPSGSCCCCEAIKAQGLLKPYASEAGMRNLQIDLLRLPGSRQMRDLVNLLGPCPEAL
ncbi:unnamed protein product [Symbiodinium natans]|uniref:Uncharacterized protein n=1 Tax=Symbiodinium natans TaxID=878477 RepID=A0A812R7X4_9DINO|nr:unnamed protein product [Symbiodinium natans]